MVASRSTTPSEGEIVESDSEKATTSLPSVHGISVDRHSRKRASVSRSPSPIRSPVRYMSRTRSRSPYRDSRGAKRPREDDHYPDQDRSDNRRFKVRYEDRVYGDRPRGHSPYKDLDRFGGPDSRLRYDDRGKSGRPRDKRPRTQSRSPPRYTNKSGSGRYGRETRDSRPGERREREPAGRGNEESRNKLSQEQSVRDRGNTPIAAVSSRRDAETKINQTQHSRKPNLGSSNITDKYVLTLQVGFVC